jgi:serine/threonine protein kinase
LSKGKLSDAEALRFFQELVDGVDYCHSHLICHRDLVRLFIFSSFSLL